MIKAGLDIGNSKISCVVCDLKKLNKPIILSFVSLPTSDVNKGSFTNYDSISEDMVKTYAPNVVEGVSKLSNWAKNL